MKIENWPLGKIELGSSILVTNGFYLQLLLSKVIICYIPIHNVLGKPGSYFTFLKLCKCSQIPHSSTRVLSTFCGWYILKFDTSYKGEKPFLPALKLLGLTCVICCNQLLYFPYSAMFKDFLFPNDCNSGLLLIDVSKIICLSS